MENKKKTSKGLLVGIIGAVVVLAVVLVLLLTQCTGGQNAPATTATTAAQQETQGYTLYWNLDRAEYDGKSEAGMSSRMPESDGYFHIRLFCDGEEILLKTADRKVVNKLDRLSLLGIELDEEGYIVDVFDVEDLPVETTGWNFYVQSLGGNTLKLNSSDSFAGMELLLDISNTRIYDMTGLSGPVGCEATPTAYDRVYPIMDLEGNLTHLFLYDRTQFMQTSEADCQHCEEKVQWNEWTRADAFPTKTGHYKLMTDVQMPGQISLATDIKICLDLNGHTVTGKTNTRLVSLHNPGTSFALMDTSEAQTGKLVGHSTSSPQGGIVWVRYGQFHMYAGTLDGSDMVSRLNGTVVQVPKNAFFYMYGGEIIGGTAQPQRVENTSTGYGYGVGGALQIAGTFRMHGGTIRDGRAPAAYYYNKGKLAIARGMGGNVFLSSGAVMEMTGGEILNGYAGNVGANIMMDGTAELTISGGRIAGGWTNARVANKHGGNIYCGGKSTIIMTGGSIEGGNNKTAAGGNLYLAGKLSMSGGRIFGGKAGTSGGNIHMGSTAKFFMNGGSIWGGEAKANGGNINVSGTSAMVFRGGVIQGGVAGNSGGNIAVNTSGTFGMTGGILEKGVANGAAAGFGGGNIALVADNTKVTITGGTIIDGVSNGTVNEDGTTVGGDGGNININRGTVVISGGTITGGKATGNSGGIYIGWNSAGLELSGKAKVYGNEDMDICRSNNTSATKSLIRLGSWVGNPEDVAAPVVGRLSGIAGSLVVSPAEGKTMETADLAKFVSNSPVLPLVLKDNGTIIYGKPDLGEADHTHCLCAGKVSGHTCADTGFVSVDAETFDRCWSVGTSSSSLMGSLNMCLTEDITIDTEYAISGNTLNLCLHGHTVHMEGNARITANGTTGVLNITDCTGTGKIVAAEGCRASFVYTYKGQINLYAGTVDASGLGAGFGALRVGYAGDVINMYGGTVIGSKNASTGGSVYVGVAGTFNFYGGTIRDGVASTSGGGNIFLNHDGAVVNIAGGTISGGRATATTKGNGLGGNIHVIRGTLNITGGTVIGGSAKGLTDDGEPAGITGGIYIAYNAKPFTLSGNAKIYGNTGSDIWLTSKASYMVTLGDWNGNGSHGALVIGKTGSGVGTQLINGAQKADMDKFTTVRDDLVLKLTGSKIILATPFVHEHCICQGSLEHTCQNVSFIEVANASEFKNLFNSSGALIESVNVALTGSFTLSAEYKTAGKTLNLCLNGHTITMSGNGRLTANGKGELNITDCDGSGKIAAAAGCRHSFLYVYESTMNLYAGTVDASAIVLDKKDTKKSGGAVTIDKTDDVFHMYGGEIIGATIYRGGSIYAYKGLFHMHGGSITGGNADVGGGVATDYGTFIMDGGVITGNTADTNGAGVYLGYQSSSKFNLADDAKIYGNTGANDIYAGQKVAANRVLVLDGWKGNGANGAMVIARSGAADGALMATAKEGVLTETELGMLASGHDGLELKVVDGKIVLAIPFVHKHCICADTLVHNCEELSFIEVKTKADFDALFSEGKELMSSVSIALTGSFTLDAEYKTAGKTLNLCLNGQTITMSGNGRLTASGSGELNITDCTGSGKIVAAAGCRHSFLYVYESTMNLYAGTVDASAIVLDKADTAKSGGAVNVYNTGDEFHMYGGEIIGATIYRGGGVYAYYGTFYMHGGRITGGNVDVGGAVATDRGAFVMDGGVITASSADTNGAAVFLGFHSTSKFVLSGDAKIYGNTGANDVYSGQKNAADNVVVLDGWKGNGANGALVIASRNGVAGSVMATAKEGVLTETELSMLASGHDGMTLALDSNGAIVLKEIVYHKHCICNGTQTGVDGHTCTELTFTEVANAEEFKALFDSEGLLKQSVSIVLTGSFTLDREYKTAGNTLDLCLNGQTITMDGNGRLTANGGAGELNITDCGRGKIAVAATGTNAFIYAQDTALNLYAGTLDALAIDKEMAEGTGNGGAVYVNTASASFNMYGGTVKGGKLYRGGGVYVHLGTFTMHDGTVTGGRAALGGNVAVNQGTFVMKGGVITGGTAKTNGGGVHMGHGSKNSLVLSGDAAIYGNEGPEDLYLGMSSAAKNVLILDGWTGNGANAPMVLGSRNAAKDAVMVTAKTGSLDGSLLSEFTYPGGVLQLALADGKYVLQEIVYHEHCICNGTLAGDMNHTCQKVTFTEVGTADAFVAAFGNKVVSNETVNICLTNDITLTEEVATYGRTVNLCLNGHTITLSSAGRLTANQTTGVLNLGTCNGGQILAASGNQTSILYTYSGNINIYGGTVNAAECAAGAGGAVRVGSASDTFTLYNGTVIGSKKGTTGGTIYCAVNGTINIHDGELKNGVATTGGGNIYMTAGELNITGGTISGGKGKTSGNLHIGGDAVVVNISAGTITGGTTTGTGINTGLGGNIHLVKGTVNITGGTITGGTATGKPREADPAGQTGGIYVGYNAKALKLGSAAKVYGNTGLDVCLTSKSDFVLKLDGWAGNGDKGALKIGKLDAVDGTQLAAPVSGSLTAADVAKFATGTEGTALVLDAKGGISLDVLHYHCVCNGKVSGNDTHTCKKLVWTEVNAEQFLALFGTDKLLTADHSVVLTENVTLIAEYKTNGHTLNLCLGDKTITMGANGRLTKNGTNGAGELNITACGGGGIVVTAAGKASAVYVQNGPLNLYSGTINASALTTTGNGGAVYVNMETASFNMYGGTVTAAASASQGGAVYVNEGAMTMYDGTIDAAAMNNSAGYGGAVYVNTGTMTMHDGTVKAAEQINYGGAVYVNKGTLTMNDGTIYGGESVRGGAVFAQDAAAVFEMHGGLISGGSAEYGGCVGCNFSKFTMTGGEITGGSATISGAGVNIHYNVTHTVDISGTARIYGNSGADIHLGQKGNQFITLDTAWTGNGATPMVISRGTETAGASIVVAKEGSLTESMLANFTYLNDEFALAISSGKIVINAK